MSTEALESCFRRVICRGMKIRESHLRQPHGGFLSLPEERLVEWLNIELVT
jgi:hypothetical protein